ncbi:MAG: excinuclease ABC subunit UvrC [Propionibacteriaceae bacterium]|jgi:excinuclease ABC subunit C|nr:excinuclease ABC subunit UvrC [Propionibacteriaceae bacterium]
MADPKTYRPKTGEIPTSPGVYRFSDAEGRIIYVGKAISLRSRLNSYFADPATLAPKTRRMVFAASKVEWTVVRTEVEALQLEYTWIKQFDPRFNVKYRDDKTYPWLCVTWSEEFPRAFVGRGAKRRGWRYFGPYGQAWAIRESLDTLLTVFPMRSCSNGVFAAAKASGRPCLMGYIDKCCAPCVGRIEPDEHRAIASDFCSVMGGRITGLLRRYETEMTAAAEALEFERAAALRDKLGALRKVAERNAVVLPDGTDADLIALADDPLEVAVQIFQVRDGRIVAERGWVADRNDDSSLTELTEAFLLQFYAEATAQPGVDRHRLIPPEILVAIAPGDDALAALLTTERGSTVRIRVPQRGDKRDLLDTAASNAAATLSLHKTRRASDLTTRSIALEEIQTALGLPEAPLRIECYDISHLQGTNTVASMVVFEDGMARKSEYRHFTITTVGSDDTGAMREVLTRRFQRLIAEREALAEEKEKATGAGETIEEGLHSALVDPDTRAPRRFSYPPQLVVVDGAGPQADVARAVLDELGFGEVAVCGLAKRLEEVWVPGEEYPLILPRASEGMYLLQRVRDESHRFAISHHRKRRAHSMIESVLDDVRGLGEVKRKALLRRFGSLKKLRAATAEEIAAVPGFGPALAQAVVDAVRQEPPGEAVNMTTGEILST